MNKDLIADMEKFLEWPNSFGAGSKEEAAEKLIRQAVAALKAREWQDISSAPKGSVVFSALIDGLPYKAMYDELDRFIWFAHGNISEGAHYRIHEIDGKQMREEIKPATPRNYQKQGYIWRDGFEHKPTHWQEYTPPTKGSE